MGIASDLRQSVLQAAMQGKLTTQKAEERDENAAPADFIVDYVRAYQYIDIIDAK